MGEGHTVRVLKIQAQEDILDDAVGEVLGYLNDEPWDDYLYYMAAYPGWLESMEQAAVKVGLPMEKKEADGKVAYRIHDTAKDHLLFSWVAHDGSPHMAGFYRPHGPIKALDTPPMSDLPWKKVTL